MCMRGPSPSPCRMVPAAGGWKGLAFWGLLRVGIREVLIGSLGLAWPAGRSEVIGLSWWSWWCGGARRWGGGGSPRALSGAEGLELTVYSSHFFPLPRARSRLEKLSVLRVRLCTGAGGSLSVHLQPWLKASTLAVLGRKCRGQEDSLQGHI